MINLFNLNKFTVKINTDLAIAWLADSEDNTYEMSQDIADLNRKCGQINERIFKDLRTDEDIIMLDMFQEIIDAPKSIPRCRMAAREAIRVINKRIAKNAY